MQRAKVGLATAVGLGIALGWPFIFFGQGRESLADVGQDAAVILREWCFTLAILAIVFFWERRSAGSLGLRMPTWRDLGAMVLIGAATIVVSGATAFLTLRGSHGIVDPRAIAALPFTLRLGMTLTAGICEEILYRGFATERLITIFGNRWIAGLVVVVAFGLAHANRYGLNVTLLVPTVTGGMLTLLYVWRRNLPICMLLHAAIDGITFLIVPLAVH